MEIPETPAAPAAHTLPSSDKSSITKNKANTIPYAQQKDDSPHSTSLMLRTVKLAAKIALSLVTIPLAILVIEVVTIFLYPPMIYKIIYTSIPEEKKIAKYIAAVTLVPVATITVSLLVVGIGILNGIDTGLVIVRDLSLNICREKFDQYKKIFDNIVTLNTYDAEGNIINNPEPR